MNDKLEIQKEHQKVRMVLVVGTYDSESKAARAVEKLIEQDFPADQISLLHKSGGMGDDMLGLAYSDRRRAGEGLGRVRCVLGSIMGIAGRRQAECLYFLG